MIVVDGADQLERTARDAADELENLSSTNRRVAGVIAGRVRPPYRTGRLAGSIEPSATDREAIVSSPLVYAPVQEYGWPRRNIRARKFMATAAAVTQPAAIAIYGRQVKLIVADVEGA